MKKHIRFIITICLALCMVLCLGLAVACQNNSDDGNTFTITVLNENGTPATGFSIQYCSDGEGAQCTPTETDSKGKVSIDIGTDEWKNSEKVHIQFYGCEEGYTMYDAEGNACDYDPVLEVYEDYVDHHTVKSATYTVKIDPTLIEAGVEYDIRDFAVNELKSYYTSIRGASGAILEADVHGGEYALSVSVDGATPTTYTLDASHTSVELEFASSMFPMMGNSVAFKLTAKNSTSARATFTLCPVFEFDGTGMFSVNQTETYKAYYNLTADSTELAFFNPYGDISEAITGYPVTLTIGTASPITWNSASDIVNVTVNQKGKVPFYFEFGGEVEDVSMTLAVEDANASAGITVDTPVVITLENSYDYKELSFIPAENGNYILAVQGTSSADISYSIPDKGLYPNPYKASEHDGNVEIELKNLEAGVEVVIVFGTENSNGETYTAIITKSISSITPEDVTVGVEYDADELTADEASYYTAIITGSKAIIEANVYGGEFELSITSGTANPITETLSASNASISFDLEYSTRGTEVNFTITPKNASSTHIAFTLCEVKELGDSFNAGNVQSYKVYYILSENSTTLAFTNPSNGAPIGSYISGYPITLTIGSDSPVIWTTGDDVQNVTTTQKGNVPFVFELSADAEHHNLYMTIDVAEPAGEAEGDIVIGQSFNVDLEAPMYTVEFTFIPKAAGTYVITATGCSNDAFVQYTKVEKSQQSDKKNGSSGSIVEEIEAEAGEEITITFSTDSWDMDPSEHFTAVITKKN